MEVGNSSSPARSRSSSRELNLFELEVGASLAEIRAAYRRLSLLWHPDRFDYNPKSHPAKSKEEAEAKIKEINNAYEILTKGFEKSEKSLNDEIWLAQTRIEIALEIMEVSAEEVFEEGLSEAAKVNYIEHLASSSNKEELEKRYDKLLFKIRVIARAYKHGFLKRDGLAKKEEEAEEATRKVRELEEKVKLLEEINRKRLRNRVIGVVAFILLVSLVYYLCQKMFTRKKTTAEKKQF